jgi:aldehyde dehydrogenase (NAD+)
MKGIDEGATLVTGGLGRPEGLHKGYDVWPTAFADVTNDMTIVREEVFRTVVVDHRLKDDADAWPMTHQMASLATCGLALWHIWK